MIIYNVGLPKTGTKSITYLLKEYGFNVSHPNITDENFDYDFLFNNKEKWELDNHFYCNTPIWHPYFWDIVNINNHKIICTDRNKEDWVKSVLNYKYFRKRKLIKKDRFWFNSYFVNFTKHDLSKLYDKHKENTEKLNNVLFINIIENDNIESTKKICDFLEIEYNESIILNDYK